MQKITFWIWLDVYLILQLPIIVCLYVYFEWLTLFYKSQVKPVEAQFILNLICKSLFCHYSFLISRIYRTKKLRIAELQLSPCTFSVH